MSSKLTGFLKNTFQDRLKRHLVILLVILGVVLVLTGQQQSPVIQALEVTKDRHGHCYLIQEPSLKHKVGRGQLYDIECTILNTTATLLYVWEYDGGEIDGEGPVVTWTAPNSSGEVTVKVTVRDRTGKEASESVILNVVSCSPCTFRGCP